MSKNGAIIAFSSLLLVAIIAAVAVVTINPDLIKGKSSSDSAAAGNNNGGLSTSVKAIKDFCEPTDYKQTCENSLTQAALNDTDPKTLAIASFRANVEHLKQAVSKSAVLVNAQNDPEAANVLEGCQTYLRYGMQNLEEAITNIEGYQPKDMWRALYDVQIFLGSATRFQEECIDDFKNASSAPAVAMKEALNTSMELTSNALAIVNKLIHISDTFDISSFLKGDDFSRRLLSADENEGFPSWVSASQRRLLQSTNPWSLEPTFVVAQDGSGQYTTISEALKNIPRKSKTYVVIYIKEGFYQEKVVVGKDMTFVVMVGDGKTKTKISASLSVALTKNMTTFRSATLSVMGSNFIGKDIGVENTAGPEGHQAVAMRAGSHRSVFYNCQFDGFQDTLYAHSMTQFYRDCTITGTVDFIFGDANSYFQNCQIIVRKTDKAKQVSVVTAQGRKDHNENSGIILDGCKITAEPALIPILKANPIYLGRPWKPYARTLFVNCDIDDVIVPAGFSPMGPDPMDLETCFYAEVGNKGPGANTANRVKWGGIKNLDYSGLSDFAFPKFMGTDIEDWVTPIGVPVNTSFQ